jgi:hypothetical protein
MSQRFPQIGRRMKKTSLWQGVARRLIATFGNARLVETWDGGTEILGGTSSDHREAREWISLFLHEATPTIRSVSGTATGAGRFRP